MQQFDVNKRFHLVARRKDNNQDEVLYEFNEEYNFDYYIDLADKNIYKEVSILETGKGIFPICRKYVPIPDNTPYFEKYKKRELKKNDRKNIR